MMPWNYLAYEYNPAVMEQHSLGNSVLDLVAHVPDQDGDYRTSENLKGLSSLSSSEMETQWRTLFPAIILINSAIADIQPTL